MIVLVEVTRCLFPKATFNRALTVDDIRGISISPAVSKLFEHADLNRFAHYIL